MALKTISLNVMLSSEERSRVEHLAKARNQSIAAFVRDKINAAFLMDTANVQTCSSGWPCLVPQMHRDPLPQPDPPRTA